MTGLKDMASNCSRGGLEFFFHWKHCQALEQAAYGMVESPSLVVLKNHADMVLRVGLVVNFLDLGLQ